MLAFLVALIAAILFAIWTGFHNPWTWLFVYLAARQISTHYDSHLNR